MFQNISNALKCTFWRKWTLLTNSLYKWNIVYTQRKFMISFTYFNPSVIIASLTQRYLWHLYYSVMHINIPSILQVPLVNEARKREKIYVSVRCKMQHHKCIFWKNKCTQDMINGLLFPDEDSRYINYLNNYMTICTIFYHWLKKWLSNRYPHLAY